MTDLRMCQLKVNDLPESCYATPALADGMIVVRSEHSLWAFRQGGNQFTDSQLSKP